MQNVKQVAQVLQQCNAQLGFPTSVKSSSLDQSEVGQNCLGDKAASPHDSCKPPTPVAGHEGTQCCKMSTLDEADTVADTNLDWANKEETLSFRKRPLRAIMGTERPLKRSAVSQQQTHSHSDLNHALAQECVTGGSSSTAASCAAPKPLTQPSRPTQSYTTEAVDYICNLQQSTANVMPARVSIDMQCDMTPTEVQLQTQAATDTQAKAEALTCAQSDTSPDAQAHMESAQGYVGNTVGHVLPDPVDESHSGHQTCAVAGACTAAQQQLIARLLHHYTATRGPTWLFC